jgi:hypothetical protein
LLVPDKNQHIIVWKGVSIVVEKKIKGKKKRKAYRHRSAKSGEFVTKEKAEESPDTTVKEEVKQDESKTE